MNTPRSHSGLTTRLDGQVALVTGSSSGIGEAVAHQLSALGARVVVNSSSSVDAGRSVADSLPGEAIYVRADISNPDEVAELFDTIHREFGRLDILVNNAGWTTVVPHGDLDALDDELIRKTFEVNVFGTLAVTKAAMPSLRESAAGNVVMVASIAALRPIGSSMAYSMAKAAMVQMTKLFAKSYGPVRFNAVAPGLVDSPWTASWDEERARVKEIAPVPRGSSPDEQAHAVISCITNPYMTGAVITVDGGLSLVL